MKNWLSKLVFGVDIDQLQAELVRRKREKARLANAVNTANAQCVRQVDEINRLKAEICQLKNENDKLTLTVSARQSAVNRLTDRVRCREETIVNLKSTIQQQELDIQSKAAEIVNLNESVASQSDEVARLNEAVANLIENNNRKDKAISELKNDIQQKELALQVKLVEIDSLNDALTNSRNEVASLKREIANTKSSVKDKDDEISSLNVELGLSKRQIDEKDGEIQRLNEEIQTLERSKKQLEFNWDEEKRECDKCSSENRVLKSDNNALKSENDRLKEQLAEIKCNSLVSQPERTQSDTEAEQPSDAEPQSGSETEQLPDAEAKSDPTTGHPSEADPQPKTKRKRTTSSRSPIASNGTDVSGGDIPTIGNGKQKSHSSIRKVVDTETGKEIEADKFFQRDNDSIQNAVRFLGEAQTTELPKFVCFECNQPVKIAKRGNNYYFQHWTSNPDCEYTPWESQPHSAEHKSLMPEETGEDRDEMLDKICRQILNRSDVESAKKRELIPSVFPYMFYRRADIFVEFRNGNRLVIQFMDGKTSLKSLVDKDIFFWLHGIYVMWVYSNEADDYSGIRSIANQNAIFYCHRNIFFYDKECREKSDERDEFIFKCNYLDEDNNWHYNKDSSSKNGELITLGDLTLPHDDVELKPYYFEANKPYFDLHPDKKGEYIGSHRNREDYVEQLKKDWFDNPVRREAIKRCMASNTNTSPFCRSKKWGLRFQGIKIVSNIFDEEPKLVNGVYVVCCNGQYGLVSGCSDKVLFDWTGISEISPLRENLFKFKKDRRYGIVDPDGVVRVSPEYVSITCMSNGLYKLDTGVYTKIVNEEFNEVEEEKVPLKDGFVKIKRRGLWGVKNGAGEIVVDCKYSEISSFRSRFIGFINNKAIRLTASGNYNYRLPMCIGNSFRREGTRYVVNIGGQKCVLQVGEHLPRISDGKINVAIENMLNDRILITLNNTSKPLSKPIDKPGDFEMNETYSGKVCRILHNGKSTNYILKMDNGKEIFVNGKAITKGYEKLAVDTEVKITKTGYNHQLDKTLWKRFEQS